MTNKFNKPHKEHYREKMKIYIIQMYSNTFPSKLVKFVTKYKYSHIGICLDKECNLIYSFGRKSLNNFLNGGFVIEPKTGDFFKKFNQNDVLVSEQSLYGMVNKKTLILLIILLQCYLCSNMVNI